MMIVRTALCAWAACCALRVTSLWAQSALPGGYPRSAQATRSAERATVFTARR